MKTGMSLIPFQTLPDVDDFLCPGVCLIEAFEIWRHLQCFLNRHPRRSRNRVGQLRCVPGSLPKHSPHILQHHLSSHRSECDDAADIAGTILLRDVLDDFRTTGVLNICVNPYYPAFRHISIGSRLYLVLPNASWLI